jgi:hypothetical protein
LRLRHSTAATHAYLVGRFLREVEGPITLEFMIKVHYVSIFMGKRSFNISFINSPFCNRNSSSMPMVISFLKTETHATRSLSEVLSFGIFLNSACHISFSTFCLIRLSCWSDTVDTCCFIESKLGLMDFE